MYTLLVCRADEVTGHVMPFDGLVVKQTRPQQATVTCLLAFCLVNARGQRPCYANRQVSMDEATHSRPCRL